MSDLDFWVRPISPVRTGASALRLIGPAPILSIDKALADISDKVAELVCQIDSLEENWRSFVQWWDGDCANDPTPAAIENAIRVSHEVALTTTVVVENVAEKLAKDVADLDSMIEEVTFSNHDRLKLCVAGIQPAVQRLRDIRDAAKVWLADLEVEAQQRQLAVVDIIQERLDTKAKLREINPSVEERITIAPAVRDIDAIYDDVELTDEEADELDAQRASGLARPTIPLVRFHRP